LEEMQRYADQLLMYWPMGIEEPESEEEFEVQADELNGRIPTEKSAL
jgi:hypothetical protein